MRWNRRLLTRAILGCNPKRRSTFRSRNNRRCARLSHVQLICRFLFLEHSDSLLQKMFSLAVYEAQDVGIPLLQSIQLLNLHWNESSNKLIYNNRDSFRFFLFVSFSKFSESNDYLNHLKTLEPVSNESESNLTIALDFTPLWSAEISGIIVPLQ